MSRAGVPAVLHEDGRIHADSTVWYNSGRSEITLKALSISTHLSARARSRTSGRRGAGGTRAGANQRTHGRSSTRRRADTVGRRVRAPRASGRRTQALAQPGMQVDIEERVGRRDHRAGVPADRFCLGGWRHRRRARDAAQLRHRRARVPLLRRTPRADRDHRRSGGDARILRHSGAAGDGPEAPSRPVSPRCFRRPERPVSRGATGRHARAVRFPACLVRTSRTARRAPPCTVRPPPYAPGGSVRA